MSEYKAALYWKNDAEDFRVDSFSRDHTVTFPGGITIDASSAPPFHASREGLRPRRKFRVTLPGAGTAVRALLAAPPLHFIGT